MPNGGHFLQPVAVGQVHVEKDKIIGRRGQQFLAVPQPYGIVRFVAPRTKQGRQGFADHRVVVDYQDSGHFILSGTAGL